MRKIAPDLNFSWARVPGGASHASRLHIVALANESVRVIWDERVHCGSLAASCFVLWQLSHSTNRITVAMRQRHAEIFDQ